MSRTIGQQLQGLKKWIAQNACAGRKFKTPGNQDLDIKYREPVCKLFLYTDDSGVPDVDEKSAPCILILMKEGGVRDSEQRFDRFKNVHRTGGMSGMLSVQFVFVTVDPGHRTEKSQSDHTNADIEANEEEAFIAVLEWAEDTMNKLVELGTVPGTDLTVDEADCRFGPMSQYGVLMDRRPLYYAVMECTFGRPTTQSGERAGLLGAGTYKSVLDD